MIVRNNREFFKGIILIFSVMVIMSFFSGSDKIVHFFITIVLFVLLTSYFEDIAVLKGCLYLNRSLLQYSIVLIVFYTVFLLPNIVYYFNGYFYTGETIVYMLYQNIIIAVEEEYASTFLITIALLNIMKKFKKNSEFTKKDLIRISVVSAFLFSVSHITNRELIYLDLINRQGMESGLARLFTVGSLIPIFLFGLFLSVMFFRTHNLLLTATLHFSWNFCVKITVLNSLLPYYKVLGIELIVVCALFFYTLYLYKGKWDLEFFRAAYGS